MSETKIGTIKQDILHFDEGNYQAIISFDGEKEDAQSFLNHTNGFVRFFIDAFSLGCRGKYKTKVRVIIEKGKITFEELK